MTDYTGPPLQGGQQHEPPRSGGEGAAGLENQLGLGRNVAGQSGLQPPIMNEYFAVSLPPAWASPVVREDPSVFDELQSRLRSLGWRRGLLIALIALLLPVLAALGLYFAGFQPVKNFLDPYITGLRGTISLPVIVEQPQVAVPATSCVGASFVIPIDRMGTTLPLPTQAPPGATLGVSDLSEWTLRFSGDNNPDAETLIASMSGMMPENAKRDWEAGLRQALAASFQTGCFVIPSDAPLRAHVLTTSPVPPMVPGQQFTFDTPPQFTAGSEVQPTATATIMPLPTEVVIVNPFVDAKANLTTTCAASPNAALCEAIGLDLMTSRGVEPKKAAEYALSNTSSDGCFEHIESASWEDLADPNSLLRVAMARQGAWYLQLWGSGGIVSAVSEKDAGTGVYKVCVNTLSVPSTVPDGRVWYTAADFPVRGYSSPYVDFMGGLVSITGQVGPRWVTTEGSIYEWVCGADGLCVFPVYVGDITPTPAALPTMLPTPRSTEVFVYSTVDEMVQEMNAQYPGIWKLRALCNQALTGLQFGGWMGYERNDVGILVLPGRFLGCDAAPSPRPRTVVNDYESGYIYLTTEDMSGVDGWVAISGGAYIAPFEPWP